MAGTTDDGADRCRRFLERLVADDSQISDAVVEIDDHTWAIHGSIAVDGEVILAEFSTEGEARGVLSAIFEPGRPRPAT